MFTVSVETYFWASHRLVLPDGSMVRQAHHPERSRRKEPLHNHNWSVTADVSSEKLDSMAVVMDFQKLKEMVDNIVAEFDNTKASSSKVSGLLRSRAAQQNTKPQMTQIPVD